MKRGLSQEQVAAALKTEQCLISRFELYGAIRLDMLVSLARFYDASLDYLVFGEEAA